MSNRVARRPAFDDLRGLTLSPRYGIIRGMEKLATDTYDFENLRRDAFTCVYYAAREGSESPESA